MLYTASALPPAETRFTCCELRSSRAYIFKYSTLRNSTEFHGIPQSVFFLKLRVKSVEDARHFPVSHYEIQLRSNVKLLTRFLVLMSNLT